TVLESEDLDGRTGAHAFAANDPGLPVRLPRSTAGTLCEPLTPPALSSSRQLSPTRPDAYEPHGSRFLCGSLPCSRCFRRLGSSRAHSSFLSAGRSSCRSPHPV